MVSPVVRGQSLLRRAVTEHNGVSGVKDRRKPVDSMC